MKKSRKPVKAKRAKPKIYNRKAGDKNKASKIKKIKAYLRRIRARKKPRWNFFKRKK